MNPGQRFEQWERAKAKTTSAWNAYYRNGRGVIGGDWAVVVRCQGIQDRLFVKNRIAEINERDIERSAGGMLS